MITLLSLFAASALIPSSPELGVAEGRCRPHEPGPALLITLAGLKDRKGIIRAELYPANDQDFLQDDNILVSNGKTFRRVVERVPASGPVELCLRVPAPGRYALSVVHDRNGGGAFSLSKDGIGFAGNPRIGLSRPKAAAAAVEAGAGLTPTTVIMNYRRGLFSFGPLEDKR